MDGVPIQMIRAHPADPASPPGGTGEAEGGGRPAARPVVAARSGGGGAAVQRMAIQGAAPGLPAARMVHAAPAAAVQRMDATTAPPAGAPPAELPTATAAGAQGAGGANTAELAEQVYGLLLRRLQNERKQRGW